jgi:hypothetical protein
MHSQVLHVVVASSKLEQIATMVSSAANPTIGDL